MVPLHCHARPVSGQKRQDLSESAPATRNIESPAKCQFFIRQPISHPMSGLPPKADVELLLP